MTLDQPPKFPDKSFFGWFYEQDPEDQVRIAEHYGFDFTPVQKPVDPRNFVPCESEKDPNYRDAMTRRVPYPDLDEEDWVADMANGLPCGHHTPHYLPFEADVPEVDLTPYTCPTGRAAS